MVQKHDRHKSENCNNKHLKNFIQQNDLYRNMVFHSCSGGERVNQGKILTMERTTRGKNEGRENRGKEKIECQLQRIL